MIAATAHLIIDPNLLVVADEEGHIELDRNSLPIRSRLNAVQRFLSASQFLEYLEAFRIGRHAEAARNELFTLSGACAIFRRPALLQMKGYRGRTVSEDTDATLTLQRAAGRVGYLPQVRVHLAPTVHWTALFAQRVRWQRGELEVLAVNADLIGRGSHFWRWSMPRRLQDDHALALLRLVWAFLLPLFPILGYPPTMIAQAMVIMYALYVLADAIQMGVAYPICARSERNLLREAVPYLPFLPVYRTATYVFRLSGILATLSEQAQWTIKLDWADRVNLPGSRRLTGWLHSLVDLWSE
jgi:cellulose synthase/poly-beta-1,6-N-acetylglucosamine synthase-like glycosyltransferase